MPNLTRLLTRSAVAGLLDIETAVTAVEEAFRRLGEGKAPQPAVLGYPCADGGFHLKAASLDLERSYFAVKCNGNYPGNPERRGLPAIQGAILLCDAADGRLLGVLDSVEITAQRTAAATVVAARHCARAEAAVVTVCGCGVQGRYQVRALSRYFRLRRVHVWDASAERACAFAREMSQELGLEVEAVERLREATLRSDMVVTCTPSRSWFLGRADVSPGVFVAAVGADSETKQEVEPELLASSVVVVDVLEQAATIGDLHHALASGVMVRGDVYADLGAIVAGRRQARNSAEDVIVFDSTGTALQDVALAAHVWRRAQEHSAGFALDFAD